MAAYENVIFRCSFHQPESSVNREWSADAFLYAAVLAYQLFESIWACEFLLWNVFAMTRRTVH